MSTNRMKLIVAAAALLIAACATTSTAAGNTPAPSASGTAAPAASPSASAVATTMDPCQLVTASEASQLTGVSYTAGQEETTAEGGKLCWYGAQTKNIFEVFVGQAENATTAQSQWDQEKARAQQELQKAAVPGVTLNFNVSDTTLPGADRAADGTFSFSGNGHTVAGAAVYLLKGATFAAIVGIVVDGTAPTASAMEGQAQTVLGRLP